MTAPVVEMEPREDAPFPISATVGLAPLRGAICRLCFCCGEMIGVAPRGLRLYEALPDGRPLLCGDCFKVVMRLIEAAEKEIRANVSPSKPVQN